MTRLSDLGVEELAEGICLRAGRIAAAEAERLAWIAEFDRREGWAGPGMLSCAHWLSWKIGLSPGAAREQVRVARRLEELPELAAAFGEGRVSYSKARAITRVAEPGDGVDWVELARHTSAGQLEKLVRGVRRAQANEAARLDPQAAEWSLRTRLRYDGQGNFTLTISGPGQFLPELQVGIEAKKAELQRERDAAAQHSTTLTPPPTWLSCRDRSWCRSRRRLLRNRRSRRRWIWTSRFLVGRLAPHCGRCSRR